MIYRYHESATIRPGIGWQWEWSQEQKSIGLMLAIPGKPEPRWWTFALYQRYGQWFLYRESLNRIREYERQRSEWAWELWKMQCTTDLETTAKEKAPNTNR